MFPLSLVSPSRLTMGGGIGPAIPLNSPSPALPPPALPPSAPPAPPYLTIAEVDETLSHHAPVSSRNNDIHAFNLEPSALSSPSLPHPPSLHHLFSPNNRHHQGNPHPPPYSSSEAHNSTTFPPFPSISSPLPLSSSLPSSVFASHSGINTSGFPAVLQPPIAPPHLPPPAPNSRFHEFFHPQQQHFPHLPMQQPQQQHQQQQQQHPFLNQPFGTSSYTVNPAVSEHSMQMKRERMSEQNPFNPHYPFDMN